MRVFTKWSYIALYLFAFHDSKANQIQPAVNVWNIIRKKYLDFNFLLRVYFKNDIIQWSYRDRSNI